MTELRSCVGKDGQFKVGVHRPSFGVRNLRKRDYLQSLGELEDGTGVDNQANFPDKDLYEPEADLIYEIHNPFAFRGTTYINSAWADAKAAHPETIAIPAPEPCSLLENIRQGRDNRTFDLKEKTEILSLLPHPLRIALAQASTDPEELVLLARKSCRVIFGPDLQTPVGIGYKKHPSGRLSPDIHDPEVFEVLVNNPHLPDPWKNALVLKPGVQGTNEITGEYLSHDKNTHVFEYLRRNSYIPWGHFASNMANDAVRYRARDLTDDDIKGLRHLYYQRAFIRLGTELDIPCPGARAPLTTEELEILRKKILARLRQPGSPSLSFDSTLWGWNFGFGYAQSGHRLHASHQMIHHQNAMIPKQVRTQTGEEMPSFAAGDLIREFVTQYRQTTGKSFFETYVTALRNNTRTDGKTDGPSSLILAEDDHTLLFVPKAQVSEWELQLMPKTACGNILEADTPMRESLDKALLTGVKALESLGAQFVTTIEFSKRLDSWDTDQRLLYSFIPRLPYSPGTFSEAQLRWISGAYPEDVAQACRRVMKPQRTSP
ncbi:MAG: hypothetical protein M0T82_16335 [Desulfobacteraceae bacterium]|nr:hypothetical protein [Desulfobacteraceae bacterium]